MEGKMLLKGDKSPEVQVTSTQGRLTFHAYSDKWLLKRFCTRSCEFQ